MGSAILLVSLICLSGAWAHGENAPQSPPDIWDELTELRDMVVEQRVRLRSMAARLTESEDRINEQRLELRILFPRTLAHTAQLQLQATKVKQLETENAAAQPTELSARLTACEKETELQRMELNVTKTELQLQKDNIAAQATELSAIGPRLTASERETELQGTELNVTKTELQLQKDKIEELENKGVKDWPKLGFSAGLSAAGGVGPFDSETDLIYSEVISNIGAAYNPTTGRFTTPVKGAYYFRFTAYDNGSGTIGVFLYLNKRRVMFSVESGGENQKTISNAVILELSAGDEVYMRLPKGYELYSDSDQESTFSGFLLFPL